MADETKFVPGRIPRHEIKIEAYEQLKQSRENFRDVLDQLSHAQDLEHLKRIINVWNKMELKQNPPQGSYFTIPEKDTSVEGNLIKIKVYFYPESNTLKLGWSYVTLPKK